MNMNVFDFMSRVNKPKGLFQNELCECKCRLNKDVHNCKNGIIIYVIVNEKNWLFEVLTKVIMYGILIHVTLS